LIDAVRRDLSLKQGGNCVYSGLAPVQRLSDELTGELSGKLLVGKFGLAGSHGLGVELLAGKLERLEKRKLVEA
jgi:hypothetical protein